MRRIAVLSAVFMVVLAAAGVYASAGVTSVFDIGIGVRQQSMGGAYAAGDDDSSSIFFNPAGLQTLDRIELQGAYMPLFEDTKYNYIACAYPTMDFGSFGFSFAMFDTDKITLRDYTGTPINITSQQMIEVLGGWAVNLFMKDLYAGFNIKVDSQSMSVFNDTGFGADLGFLYVMSPDADSSARAAVVIKNLVEPQIKMSAVSDIVPRQLVLAGNYDRALTKDINISCYTDIYAPVGIDFVIKLGAEATFFRTFAVRAGYDSNNIASVGAGLDIMNIGAIDYGVFFSELDVEHRFSLKLRFGESVLDQRANREKIEQEKIENKARMLAADELRSIREKIDKMTGEAKKKEFFKASHYARGLETYYDGDLKSAIVEFETVQQVDPNYMNTNYYIGMIRGKLGQSKGQLYSDEILKIYRAGVDKYIKEDYAGAKEEWEKILKIDPYNRLAIESLKKLTP